MTCVVQTHLPRKASVGNLCLACYRGLTVNLALISERWPLLDTLIAPGSSESEEWHGRGIDPPAPLVLEAAVLRDRRSSVVWKTVLTLDSHLRAGRALVDLGGDMNGMVVRIVTHAEWIAAAPIAGEAVESVALAAHALGLVTGDVQPQRTLPMRCPVVSADSVCGGGLVVQTYTLGVACDRCGAEWAGGVELERLASYFPVSPRETEVGQA